MPEGIINPTCGQWPSHGFVIRKQLKKSSKTYFFALGKNCFCGEKALLNKDIIYKSK